MKPSRYRSLLLLCASLWGGGLAARADTFYVTNVNDSGTGSLRSAIDAANNNSGSDTINFRIGGTGVHTITLASSLPAIQDTVTINGYSQSGSQANTATTGSNAVLQIVLSGSTNASGFSVSAPGCTIKGIAINGLSTAIYLSGSISTGNHVEGCFIGTDAAGSRAVANAGDGIAILNGATKNVIGGTTPATRNLISGNTGRGVLVSSSGGAAPTSNTIAGNLIGTDATGTKTIANGDVGVLFDNASKNILNAGNLICGNTQGGVRISGTSATSNSVQGNTIGTNTAGAQLGNGARGVLLDSGAKSNTINAGNVIAFNAGAGVAIYGDTSTGNAIRGNSIYSNGGLGIKLTGANQFSESTPASNDVGDADSGPNNEQNWPLVTSLGGGAVSGTLDSKASTSYNIDIYANDAADASGFGEGRYYVGSVSNVKTDATGHATWSFTLPAGVQGNGQSYSATATTASGDTSEFGPAGVSGVVTNTNDSGDGSLRNAINVANRVPGTSIIFNIPTTDPNYASGVFTIKPTSGLPLITADGTIVDGDSQRTFTSGTNPSGPAIVVNGASMPSDDFSAGLGLNASHCTLHGIVVNGFAHSSGIEMVGGDNGTLVISDNQITACYVGTDATGARAVPNANGILLHSDGFTSGSGVTKCTIGGTTTAERNVVAGNGSYGILLTDATVSDINVTGNYLGVDRTATKSLANGAASIAIASAHDNAVGGTTSGAGNVIIGLDAGVRISGANNTVQGNLIGTDGTGTKVIGIGGGVYLDDGATNNLIGGTANGAGNVIAGEQAGVSIGTASSNTVQGNFVGTNSSGAKLGNQYGIRLVGVTGAIGAKNNLIGGTAPGAANIVGASTSAAIDLVGTTCSANTVLGNVVGLAPDGLTPLANTVGIVLEAGANNNTIGGTSASAANVVSGNTESGLHLDGAGTTANLVQGNLIGTNAAGAVLGNGTEGILIENGATNNLIGGTASATGTALSAVANHIVNNKTNGVTVQGITSTGNPIRGNIIAGNGALGIDLVPADGSLGVTPNDAGDSDSGPNRLQNFPLISGVAVAGGKTTVSGTLNSTANTNFVLDLYDNAAIEPSGFGEGTTYLASQTIKTDASGNATFSFTLSGTAFNGLFSLTATNGSKGDTSEFSPQGAAAVVTNTLDSGPGSLRNALTVAQTLGGATIRFNIPTTDSGFKNGVFTIAPLTALPTLSTDGIDVDGTTQTAFSGDTNLKGPEIVLDGAKAPAPTSGLTLTAAHCTVQSLTIDRFKGSGIELLSPSAASNVVSGCYIGVSADGATAAGNDTGIFVGYGPHDNTLGGTTDAARNVIAGNTTAGVQVANDGNSVMTGNLIVGNYVGLNAAGTASIPNGQGISLSGGTTGTTIGGTTAGARNVVSGNQDAGIALSNASGNRVVGNYIGTNAAGTQAVPNGSGINTYGGINTIGGTAAGEGNRIAFNRFYGIEVEADSSATDSHITMRANTIYSNGLLGIDLLGGTESYYGGVTVNDDAALDADKGPNGLQNYPLITGFAVSGSSTTIRGTLNSAANRTYALDFYRVTRPDDSGYGEGDTYLGSATINTNARGQATFSFTGTFSGQYFVATATDTASGDTSEFGSAGVTVKIDDFTPKIGPVGTAVTLKGGSFTGTTDVSFNGTKAAKWTVSADGTTLSTSVPTGATSGPITVTTPLGVAQTSDDFVVTPPFNDNFVNAFDLSSFGGNLTGYNKGATKETGEPDHAAPGGASVWYKWQTPISGRASVGIEESDFDTLLAVYTGTKVDGLHLVASNNNVGSSNRSAVSFPVTAGATYYIALDGVSAAQGRFILQWSINDKAPANDDFANAQTLDGNNGQTSGSNLLATREAGEPLHAGKPGGTSVWYTWQPSQSGFASFATQGSTIDTLLAVYTGNSVGALKLIASNDDSDGSTSRVGFNATAGTLYKIAVDGFNGAQGDVALSWTLNANQGTLIWTGNAGDGLWSNPANWNLNRIPRPTDTVTINKSGTYTVTLDVDSTIGGLILGSATSSSVKPTLLIPRGHALTFNDSVLNKNGTLALAGGTLHSNSDFEIGGLFDWTGGTWTGYHAYIAANATLDIHGTATKTLINEAITNLGYIKWRDSGNIAGDNGASILNQKTFEIITDASLTWDGTDKAPNFLNDRGAFFAKRKATTGTNHIGWIFGNDGKVSVEAGALNLEGGGVSYGDFDIATNARINVARDYVFDKQTSRFTGGGFAAIISGTTGFDIAVSATNFEFSQGQLEGKDDLSVSKKFVWTGGAMAEAGTTTMIKSSTMEISGSTGKAIAQRTLVNNGTVNWSAGNIQADNGAKISNNGSFNCVVGTKMTYRAGQKLEFNNAKGANLTGSTTISGNVTNLGHIKPLKTLRLGGGALTAADVNDGGGLINITGDMVQGSGAQIDIVINGTLDPQTQQPLYGQLLIGGNVDLMNNCGLTVTSPNYIPKNGDQFKILRALSIAGDFATISYPALPANLMWSAAKVPENGIVSYVLKVSAKPPVISSFSPTSGVAGTAITIAGQNLSNADATLPLVSCGGVKAAVQSATPTQIKALIPSGAKTGKLSVTTATGTAQSNSVLTIRPLITSISPTLGATGKVVLIKGTDLITSTTPKPTVKFNQTVIAASDLVSASATQLKVKIPATATTGKISVTTSDGTAQSATSFTFLAAPVITTVPSSGAIGATIIIKGNNFVNANTTKPIVKFGSFTAPSNSITGVSATQLKIVVPVGAKTGKITVQNSGGIALSASSFVIQ